MSFTKFTSHIVSVKSGALDADINIHCMKGGSGPALLLIHGYPQTHFIWHEIADKLAEKYTVIASDLRGYGESSKPKGSESHVEYSKKEMAADQVALMKSFGFDEFYLVAHDRGARVAHRLAVECPKAVKKMMLLDICPTLFMYETTNMKFAAAYWHWFFLILPTPYSVASLGSSYEVIERENVIMADPMAFWQALGSRSTHAGAVHTEEAIQKYQSAFFNRDTVHASCEDYRAAASIDLDHDRADLAANRKIAIPALRILWGKKGMIETYGDVVGIWKKVCEDKVEVSGHGMDSGHYIAEEKSDELLKEILGFMQ
ncbi:alpha/beta hydrolase fold protein [Athelia psychrophila]|uniref:Alpha/beta hydrolase fold protein n=1 Tax=Athelia psychrophila TaxID=1759441 RepID=A0A166PZJ0_9AGAM|nr:alpha/beta hydrolase fold protein [Fibularhizoctonia sp. CBS 109695]